MRRLWIAIAVLMFTAVGHDGKAETVSGAYYSGDVLLEDCESESVAMKNACVGYLAGIIDVTIAYEALDY